MANQASSDSSSPPPDKFIIVETNFRIYAYTQSKLYKEILKLFIVPKIEFPDMLYGELTKDKLEWAFRQRISARQIMGFLESHSHPSASYSNVAISSSTALLNSAEA
mmetsp:Transcript_11697/g.19750  ORF Transcript_11697/g.19750 Transcript_11697/m.19750 type:complete len:107 (+) Transcript_11697:1155-1475(+)